MVRDQPLGVGFGNFETAVRRYVPHLAVNRCAHNTYLEVLAELGIVGMLLLVWIFTAAMITVNWIRERARRFKEPWEVTVIGGWRASFDLGWHAMALRCSLVGYLVCAIFDSRVVAEDLWILIGMSCCLANVSAHMRGVAERYVKVERANREAHEQTPQLLKIRSLPATALGLPRKIFANLISPDRAGSQRTQRSGRKSAARSSARPRYPRSPW